MANVLAVFLCSSNNYYTCKMLHNKIIIHLRNICRQVMPCKIFCNLLANNIDARTHCHIVESKFNKENTIKLMLSNNILKVKKTIKQMSHFAPFCCNFWYFCYENCFRRVCCSKCFLLQTNMSSLSSIVEPRTHFTNTVIWKQNNDPLFVMVQWMY